MNHSCQWVVEINNPQKDNPDHPLEWEPLTNDSACFFGYKPRHRRAYGVAYMEPRTLKDCVAMMKKMLDTYKHYGSEWLVRLKNTRDGGTIPSEAFTWELGSVHMDGCAKAK